MDTYIVRLKPLSPYLTPWRTCTLWGRLCWVIADQRLPGWDIERWLAFYKEGMMPPLVVGDAFPADALPVPDIFRALPKERIAHSLPNGMESPHKTLPWDDWKSLCETARFPQEKPIPEGEYANTERAKNGKVRRAERTHVVMDRGLGRAVDGGLRSEQGHQPEELLFVAQLDNALGEDGLETLVRELCLEGWGQGRTYGYGHVELIGIERIEIPQPTGWAVTLGHCHPTDDLPMDGFWRWTGVPVRPHDPATRKAPDQHFTTMLLHFTTMLLPGACFATDKSFIGRNIPLDGRSDYLHYGLAPTWPACVRSDKD
ncbi:MAG: hypothetical protein HND42_03670 [Armatimonadetes bacterium]|nr:hypothetical protein [Armatimonadota bacterium]NOG92328.1 hypothetical protein [Armatimonadota bacterium]